MSMRICGAFPADAAKSAVARIVACACLTMWMCGTARSQTIVDCTGANTSAYKTITAALAATPAMGANIQVTGPCSETVTISGRYSLNLGAATGKTVALTGMLNVDDSTDVYVYGFQVTNTSGDGIDVDNSRVVTLDTVTSSGNKGEGVGISTASSVTILGPSSFQNNGEYGIQALESSLIDIETSAGAVNISTNASGGIFAYEHSDLYLAGDATIENNGSGPKGHLSGIAIHDGSTAELLDCTGNNVIQGNANAGIELQGGAATSIPACGAGFTTSLHSNGTYGASVALTSELTANGETQISGNPSAGILVDAGASLFVNGTAVISGNGTSEDPDTGGIVVTDNSAAQVNDASVSSNLGLGFAGSLGATFNLSSDTASGNQLGIMGCDSSSWVSSDFPRNSAEIVCSTPTIPGQHSPISPLRLTATEPPHNPAAMAEKVRKARAAFWAAMGGGLKPM